MTRRRFELTAAASLAAMLSASGAMAASGTVAFLMPDQGSTRYEEHDFPGFKAKMTEICPDCKLIYQNATADATLAALQLIVSGDQLDTISKPSEIVGAAAAEAAVKFLDGTAPEPKTTLYNTPSELFIPVVVTRDNIKAEIFDKELAKASDVCTGVYADGCKELGIE
jgi:ABC-type xylose transport system substrate-binding protein